MNWVVKNFRYVLRMIFQAPLAKILNFYSCKTISSGPSLREIKTPELARKFRNFSMKTTSKSFQLI